MSERDELRAYLASVGKTPAEIELAEKEIEKAAAAQNLSYERVAHDVRVVLILHAPPMSPLAWIKKIFEIGD